jgi:hypothetical protein
MRKSYRPISAIAMGLLVMALTALDVRADEPTKFCVNNVAEEVMRFEVTFKDGDQDMKVDSHRLTKGEKCLEVPSTATEVEFSLYEKFLIVWTSVCSKSWPTAPAEGVRVELKDSSSGLECAGL